jgi:AcrR family transcriptional regulator
MVPATIGATEGKGCVIPRKAAAPSVKQESEINRRRLAALNEGGIAYRERRALLISTAAQVFREKGYQRTSLNEIARRIGTDRASLYYYVSGKRELFNEVVSDVISNNMNYAEEVRKGTDAPDVKLRKVVTALMHACEMHYPYVYVYVQENPGHSDDEEVAAEYGKRYGDAVTAIIQEGLTDGSFIANVPANVIAYGLIGMVNWTHRWFRPHMALSGRAVGDAFVDIVLGGLYSGPPERPPDDPAEPKVSD